MNNNLYIYYKNVIRSQLLFKLNLNKIDDIPALKKISLNVYLNPKDDKYLMYFYNLCALLVLITGKFLIVKSFNKAFEDKKIYLKLFLIKHQMYNFIDMFSTILLPLFQNYNMPLRLSNFDNFGNYYYQVSYSDPVFTSKNIIISWSALNKINIIFFIKTHNKSHSLLLLQYLKFKWY